MQYNVIVLVFLNVLGSLGYTLSKWPSNYECRLPVIEQWLKDLACKQVIIWISTFKPNIVRSLKCMIVLIFLFRRDRCLMV